MGTGYIDTTTQRYPQRGDKVRVAQKQDYNTGVLTEGVVQDVLTSKRTHPRGHKVRLTDGTIGRVQEFVDYPDAIKKVDRRQNEEVQAPVIQTIDEDSDPDFDLR